MGSLASPDGFFLSRLSPTGTAITGDLSPCLLSPFSAGLASIGAAVRAAGLSAVPSASSDVRSASSAVPTAS